jgi:arginine:pyruvate transaminase
MPTDRNQKISKVASALESETTLADLVARCSGPRASAWDVTDRASDMESLGEDIIHLGVGDPDFDTPEEIVDVAVASMRSGRTHYASIPGEPELRRQIAKHSQLRYGRSVDENRVVVFPGAQCALFSVFLCLVQEGDEVILLEPAYATYDAVVEAGGAQAIRVPLDPAAGFALDIDRICNAITPKTKVILLNSPGNPSGAVFDQETVAELVSICREKGIWIVSDEVYWSMVFEGEHHSAFCEPGSDDFVIVINSLSKSHAMTGWRIGWTIAPEKVTSALISLAQALLFGVSQFSQDAAAFALASDLDSVRSMVETFNQRRQHFCRQLSGVKGIDVYVPAGGMFLLIGVSKLGMDGERFANELLDETGVTVVPGFAFGDSVKDFVRIGFLRDVDILTDAANRIRQFVESSIAK